MIPRVCASWAEDSRLQSPPARSNALTWSAGPNSEHLFLYGGVAEFVDDCGGCTVPSDLQEIARDNYQQGSSRTTVALEDLWSFDKKQRKWNEVSLPVQNGQQPAVPVGAVVFVNTLGTVFIFGGRTKAATRIMC